MPDSMARKAPRLFNTRPMKMPPVRRGNPAATASASAICGTSLGFTKLAASMRRAPASSIRPMNSNFCEVVNSTDSFWSPSRGPTSIISTSDIINSATSILYIDNITSFQPIAATTGCRNDKGVAGHHLDLADMPQPQDLPVHSQNPILAQGARPAALQAERRVASAVAQYRGGHRFQETNPADSTVPAAPTSGAAGTQPDLIGL